MSKPIYISEAADRMEISPVTLKRWLLNSRVADVRRDRNGWRVFDETDIARIMQYKHKLRAAGEEKDELETPVYRVASLFSGIGGFDLGFERAGFRIAVQCEIDEYCNDILGRRWPKVKRFGDIRGIPDGTAIPFAEVWVGGFPCQDVSLARMGRRSGLRGRQSGLFFEFARLVRKGLPRVLVIENVHGLLNSHGGKDFQTVVSTLAELGYAVGWRTLNSRYFGVPQSRRRVFIVGCHRDWTGPGTILFEPERGARNVKKSGSNGAKSLSPFKEVIGDPSGEGPVYQSIAYCLYACSARHTGTDWSRTYICYPRTGRVRRLTATECEGVMGFPSGWSHLSESKVKPADIESRRYYALGNAVTPQVSEWLALRIRSYLEASPQPWSRHFRDKR